MTQDLFCFYNVAVFDSKVRLLVYANKIYHICYVKVTRRF